jgi:hypothetical protein
MNLPQRRQYTAWVPAAAVGLTLAAIAACDSAPARVLPPVPAEFKAACGHPGARVAVRKVPVTISHARCDLTGVWVTYRNYGSLAVPRGGGTGVGNSAGFILTVRPGTLDVTINATGTPGNQ